MKTTWGENSPVYSTLKFSAILILTSRYYEKHDYSNSTSN